MSKKKKIVVGVVVLLCCCAAVLLWKQFNPKEGYKTRDRVNLNIGIPRRADGTYITRDE